MMARTHLTINQTCDFPSENVCNDKDDMPGLGNTEVDFCNRIERVRVILFKTDQP